MSKKLERERMTALSALSSLPLEERLRLLELELPLILEMAVAGVRLATPFGVTQGMVYVCAPCDLRDRRQVIDLLERTAAALRQVDDATPRAVTEAPPASVRPHSA